MASKVMMMNKLPVSPLAKPGFRSHFLIVLLLCALPALQAQQKDFQYWPSAQVNLEVWNNLKVHLEEELRLVENATQVGRQINDLGASYRFNKYLRAALYYRIEADWKNADTYRWRQGIYSDVSLKYDVARFTLGYRIRLQSAKVELIEDEPMFSAFIHRHKFSVAYDIKGLPLVPFLEEEVFLPFSESDVRAFRTWFGLTWEPGKIHELTLKYGIEKETGISVPQNLYILAVQYVVNLSLK